MFKVVQDERRRRMWVRPSDVLAVCAGPAESRNRSVVLLANDGGATAASEMTPEQTVRHLQEHPMFREPIFRFESVDGVEVWIHAEWVARLRTWENGTEVMLPGIGPSRGVRGVVSTMPLVIRVKEPLEVVVQRLDGR